MKTIAEHAEEIERATGCDVAIVLRPKTLPIKPVIETFGEEVAELIFLDDAREARR